MKKALTTLLNIICIAIIVLAIGVLFAVVTTPKGQPPQIFGFSGFRVLTGSMEPTIPTDSFVLVHRVDASKIRVDDVISFFSKDEALRGAVNTHRVVGISGTDGQIVFETKGDANQSADKVPVHASDLIGKVVLVSFGLGKLIRLISNPLVFAAVIAIPLLIVMFANIRGMAKDVKKLVAEEAAEEARKAAEQARKESEPAAEPPEESEPAKETVPEAEPEPAPDEGGTPESEE